MLDLTYLLISYYAVLVLSNVSIFLLDCQALNKPLSEISWPSGVGISKERKGHQPYPTYSLKTVTNFRGAKTLKTSVFRSRSWGITMSTTSLAEAIFCFPVVTSS